MSGTGRANSERGNGTVRLGPVKFWITPGGRSVHVEDTHIMAVLLNPRLFGYGSAEALRARFDANGEKRGSEGRTRAAILSELMGRGYMRVRRVRGGGRIVINCPEADGPSLRRARLFLGKAAVGHGFPVFRHDAVEKKVFFREPDPGIAVEFADFADGRLLLRAPLSAVLRGGRKFPRPESKAAKESK